MPPPVDYDDDGGGDDDDDDDDGDGDVSNRFCEIGGHQDAATC